MNTNKCSYTSSTKMELWPCLKWLFSRFKMITWEEIVWVVLGVLYYKSLVSGVHGHKAWFNFLTWFFWIIIISFLLPFLHPSPPIDTSLFSNPWLIFALTTVTVWMWPVFGCRTSELWMKGLAALDIECAHQGLCALEEEQEVFWENRRFYQTTHFSY